MTTHLAPGTVFGRYRMIRRLAIGGMAEIWLAQLAEGGSKPVVLKRILPQFAADEDLVERFRQEAELTLSLVHGNIVPVFEVGQVEEEPYMVMEYLPGRDLRTVMRRAYQERDRAPVGVAVYIAIETLRGLSYVHRKAAPDGTRLRLIHRDVSPSNVVVSYEGVVKLLDFGIAKVFGRSRATKTGILVGKVGYMSPEQVRGKPLTVQSDLFSTAVVLYELLAAQRLFEGESEAEILEKVRSSPIVPLHLRNPEVPKKLEAIIQKGLERDPQQRYETAKDFETDLNDFVGTAGFAADAAATVAWVDALFNEDDRPTDDVGPLFNTGTATQLPPVKVHGPKGGPALLLGGAAGSEPSGEVLAPRRWQSGLLLGITLIAVLSVLAFATGLFPRNLSRPAAGNGAGNNQGLFIKSEPHGAQIWIGDRYSGQLTPEILRGLEAGPTTITLKLEDHLPWTKEVVVPVGTLEDVKATLTADLRTLDVVSIPAGAIVSTEGHDPCTAPCSLQLMPSRNVEITAEKRGYVDASWRGKVGDRKEAIVLRLDKSPVAVSTFVGRAITGVGKISLRAKPWAYIELDGGARTEKPLVDFTVNAGPHKVVLHNPELDVRITCEFMVKPMESVRFLPVDLGAPNPSCVRDNS